MKGSAIESGRHIHIPTRFRLTAYQKARQHKVSDTESRHGCLKKTTNLVIFRRANSVQWRVQVCQGLVWLKRQRLQQIGKIIGLSKVR